MDDKRIPDVYIEFCGHVVTVDNNTTEYGITLKYGDKVVALNAYTPFADVMYEAIMMVREEKESRESLGDHLRNMIQPYQTLVNVVGEYKKGNITKEMFDKLTDNQQPFVDNIVDMSKDERFENHKWS